MPNESLPRFFSTPLWKELLVEFAAYADPRGARLQCEPVSLALYRRIVPHFPQVNLCFGNMRPISGDITLNDWEKHFWLELDGYAIDLTASQFGYPFPFVVRLAEATQGDYETATYDLMPEDITHPAP